MLAYSEISTNKYYFSSEIACHRNRLRVINKATDAASGKHSVTVRYIAVAAGVGAVTYEDTVRVLVADDRGVFALSSVRVRK